MVSGRLAQPVPANSVIEPQTSRAAAVVSPFRNVKRLTFAGGAQDQQSITAICGQGTDMHLKSLGVKPPVTKGVTMAQ